MVTNKESINKVTVVGSDITFTFWKITCIKYMCNAYIN